MIWLRPAFDKVGLGIGIILSSTRLPSSMEKGNRTGETLESEQRMYMVPIPTLSANKSGSGPSVSVTGWTMISPKFICRNDNLQYWWNLSWRRGLSRVDYFGMRPFKWDLIQSDRCLFERSISEYEEMIGCVGMWRRHVRTQEAAICMVRTDLRRNKAY